MISIVLLFVMLAVLINENTRDIVVGGYALLVQFAILIISKEDREVAAAFISCNKIETDEEDGFSRKQRIKEENK